MPPAHLDAQHIWKCMLNNMQHGTNYFNHVLLTLYVIYHIYTGSPLRVCGGLEVLNS